MTLTQLEYIIALDTHRHFVTAAEACFVTQPTLSMQVQKLEEELGTILFDRSKQPILPTLEGKDILAQARVVLQEAKRLKEIVLDGKKIIKGELKVGIIPTLSPYLVPLFLENFLTNYPEIKLKISEITTAEIIQRLKNETLDVGILATPLQEAHILEEALFDEPFVAYLPENHPLRKEKMIAQTDLVHEKLLLMEEGHCLRGQVLSFCKYKTDQSETNLQYEAGSIETLKKLVDRNMGMTILPELAIMDMDEDSMENVHYFAAPEPKRTIGMVFMRAQLKAKLMQALAKEIKAALPEKIIKH